MTVPRVGPKVALDFIGTVDDAERLPEAADVAEPRAV